MANPPEICTSTAGAGEVPARAPVSGWTLGNMTKAHACRRGLAFLRSRRGDACGEGASCEASDVIPHRTLQHLQKGPGSQRIWRPTLGALGRLLTSAIYSSARRPCALR